MSNVLSTVEQPIDRDRWGRPLVVPPDGGKPVPYTRTTTYVSCLEDTYNLARWQQRMVATGLADRPDLLLAVAAHREDKKRLNGICEEALEAAKGSAAATTGTAIHALTEIVDRGQELPVVPDGAKADLEAYRSATVEFETVAIEQFSVVDDLKVGGTPDRIVKFRGRTYIADLKTGSIEWGAGKIAMQLAVYSRAVAYDHRTRTRSPLPAVDQDRAIVIHLPAGQGECSLKWVDIAAGWDAVRLATGVRDHRSRKDWMEDVPASPPDLELLIGMAPTVADLERLWNEHQSVWTQQHTDLAARRKQQITAAA